MVCLFVAGQRRTDPEVENRPYLNDRLPPELARTTPEHTGAAPGRTVINQCIRTHQDIGETGSTRADGGS